MEHKSTASAQVLQVPVSYIKMISVAGIRFVSCVELATLMWVIDVNFFKYLNFLYL